MAVESFAQTGSHSAFDRTVGEISMGNVLAVGERKLCLSNKGREVITSGHWDSMRVLPTDDTSENTSSMASRYRSL